MPSTPHLISFKDGVYYRAITEAEYRSLAADNARMNEEIREAREERRAEEQREEAARLGKQRAKQTDDYLRGLKAAKLSAFVHGGLGDAADFEKIWPQVLKEIRIEAARGPDPVVSRKLGDPEYGL